jgi:hypothetical protein
VISPAALFNKGSLLLCEWSVCAPWHKTPQSTKEAPNFVEFVFHEVRELASSRCAGGRRVASCSCRGSSKKERLCRLQTLSGGEH